MGPLKTDSDIIEDIRVALDDGATMEWERIRRALEIIADRNQRIEEARAMHLAMRAAARRTR